MWAATRVNVEQASKRATRGPTRRITGKADTGREASDARTGRPRRGSDGGTHGRGGRWQHGKPCRWRGTRQPEPREGQAGPAGWRRGLYYRGSRVTPVEGRSPGSRAMRKGGKAWPLARAYQGQRGFGNSRPYYMRKPRKNPNGGFMRWSTRCGARTLSRKPGGGSAATAAPPGWTERPSRTSSDTAWGAGLGNWRGI